MPSPILLQRLEKFLRAGQPALVADCDAALPTAAELGEYPVFSWREQLDRMVGEVADQLAATASGAGWNIDGGVSDDPSGNQNTIERLILEAYLVRNLFLRTLNRFQASQAGQGGFNPTEMTEVRQEAMDIFDRITIAAIAGWINDLPAASNLEVCDADLDDVLPPPEEPPKIVDPTPPKQTEITAATLAIFRDGLRNVSTQIGKLRALIPAGRDDAAAIAVRQLQRMTSLLESLGATPPRTVEVIRPQPMRLTPLEVRSFLDALVEAFRPLAEQKGLRFLMTTDPALTTVETDAAKLHRAASLLIGNAIQYTEKGGISLLARATGPDWLLTVEDTGPGIEPQKLAGLLTGASLGPDRIPHGLAVTRELIQLLGGHLDADSVLRRGSRFTICLPRVRRIAMADANPGYATR